MKRTFELGMKDKEKKDPRSYLHNLIKQPWGQGFTFRKTNLQKNRKTPARYFCHKFGLRAIPDVFS